MWSTNDDRQRQYWDADPEYREFDHPVVAVFGRQRLEYLATRLDLSSIRSAIDVGCGDGFSTFYMHERIRRVFAVDRSAAMLRRHPMRRDGTVLRGDIMSLPLPDDAVDLAYCWEVLHHISDPQAAVREMARVSRRYVLIAEPNPVNPLQFAFAIVDREHRWVLRYSLDYMRRLLRGAGLRVAHAGSGGFILPNRTPTWLVGALRRLPYPSPLGISNWVIGEKV
jgi:ubiquinone/menaquinone biosynthesis C-methylase UbiE